jgi:2,5-furandicarboxylate decarboxylase 1
MTLGSAYATVDVERRCQPIRADVELTRWMATEEERRGRRPTVLFENVLEFPGASILANPYPRDVLLAALGVAEPHWQATLAERLSRPPPPVTWSPAEPGESRPDLLESVPAVRHRPGDAGLYLTAAVTATAALGSQDVNLGVYRVQVVSADTALIFFDPRTDAHRNLTSYLEQGQEMPVVLFMGGDPRYIAVAAASLPAGGNDWNVVAQLSGRPVMLAGAPGAPVDASYVVRGRVLPATAVEGPFAEFKGFYVDARPAPVLRVDSVVRRPGLPAPTIVTGRQSGLSLTAFQNELLTFNMLTSAGLPVTRVRCPLEAFGEFLILIDSPEPSQVMVDMVMAREPRAKVVICGPDLRDPWRVLSTHGFSVSRQPHHRKGKVEGDRVGLVITSVPQGKTAEF